MCGLDFNENFWRGDGEARQYKSYQRRGNGIPVLGELSWWLHLQIPWIFPPKVSGAKDSTSSIVHCLEKRVSTLLRSICI